MFGNAVLVEQDQHATETHTRLLLWTAVTVGAVAALFVTLRVGSHAIAIGSEQGHFIYRYSRPFEASMLWVCALVLATACTLACAPLDIVRRHSAWLLIVWLGASFAQQAQVRTLTPFTFEQMFASDTANSFYAAARQHEAGALLRHFRTLRRSLPLHAQSNMPGKVLFVSALGMMSTSANVQAWLVVAFSNLGAVLLYLLIVDWFGDRDTALFASVLYLFVPAKLYFFPLLNTATPTVALAWLWLFVRWMRTRRAAYAAAFGVATYALMLFDPLPLMLGLLFPLILAVEHVDWRTLIRPAAIAIGGFGAVYLIMLATFRFDLFRTFQDLGRDAAAFNADEDRRYAVWVFQNVFDFSFGAGICQAVLFVGVLIDTVRRVARVRLWPPIAAASLGLLAVLLAVDLLGVNRGEVIRLWVFLACLWQIPAAYACARLRSRAAFMVVLGVTIGQAALGTAMIGFVSP